MSPENITTLLTIGAYFVVATMVIGFLGIIYFLVNYKSIIAQAVTEQELIKEKQEKNRKESNKRFDSYTTKLEDFNNKPI